MDLIDRDAVEDIITNALNGYLTDDVRNTLEGIGIAISDMPSADIDLSDFSDKLWAAAYERGKAEAVRCEDCVNFSKTRLLIPQSAEVVRCKDCKHSYETFAGLICSHGVCVDCVVRDDFYCSNGE